MILPPGFLFVKFSKNFFFPPEVKIPDNFYLLEPPNQGRKEHFLGGAGRFGRNEQEWFQGPAIAASCDVLFPVQADLVFYRI